MPASERRVTPRIAVKHMTVLYHPLFDPRDVLHAQPQHKAVAVDLSEKGLRIVTGMPLDPGVSLSINLRIPALNQEIRLRGTVVRCVEIPQKAGTEPGFALGISVTRSGTDFHDFLQRMQMDHRLRLGGV